MLMSLPMEEEPISK